MIYSEAFKQQVVDEIAAGRFGSPTEAARAYGIGKDTVGRWVRSYGKGHLLRKVVRVDKPGEPGEINRLKERVRQLEGALADATMDKALAESAFELLCERVEIDPEEFKKKVAGIGSTRCGGKRWNLME
jgi:transposase-like protein